MTQVFISYSRRDIVTVTEIVKLINDAGYKTWRDEDNLEPGNNWTVGLELGIRKADLVFVIVSSNSLQSEMVISEARWAKDVANKLVIPVLIEEVEMPLVLYTTQYISMFKDWKQGCDSLLAVLKENLKEKPQEITTTSLHPKIVEQSPSQIDPSVNPFSGFGTIIHEDNFVGRQDDINFITDRLSGPKLASTSIIGERRIGKTSLLHYLMKRHQDLLPDTHQWAFAYMDMSTQQTSTGERFMRLIRTSIMEWTDIEPWQSESDGKIDVMQTAFHKLHAQGIRIVLCIDEFEGSIAHNEALRPFFNSLRSSGSQGEIAMLTATRISLVDLFEQWGRVSPFGNIFGNVRLRPLREEDWQKIVKSGFERTGHQATPDQLHLIGELSGGHPYLVQIASFYAWQNKHRRWGEAEDDIRFDFFEQAREPFFHDLWLEQPKAARNAIKEIVGLPTDERVNRRDKSDLRRRGLLKRSGKELFCDSFVEYIMEELG